MTTLSRQFFAALALAVMQAAVGSAQEDPKSEPAVPTKPTRAELRDKQLDVSLEARDIERVLGKLKKASDLTKERITEAAKSAESASTSLEKGDSKAARTEAQQTAEMFKEIAKQLEALLKEETPQRIAEARQLAQQLAKAEKEFAEKFQGALNPPQTTSGMGKVDPKSQVKPLTDPDRKAEGSQGKAQQGGGGKNGKKNEEDQDSEKKDTDGKPPKGENAENREPKKGDADQPGENGSKPRDDGKNGDDKPMPDGQGGGKPEGKDNGDENGDKKKPEDGSGNKPGDKPMSGGASKDKNETTTGEDQDGTGGDKPNDKERHGSGAALTAEQRREIVAERANQLAESGRTLQDVLNEIAKSTDPNDKEAVAKIQAVLKEIDIDKLVGEMGQVSNMIRSKKDDDAKLSSLDVAERLEIMAQRLDGAYRTLVAPQAEELRKLEQALADLREQLEKLETPSQVAAWHREVRDLLDKLEKLGVSPKDREYLEKEMAKAGFGLDMDRTKRAVNWSLVNGYYVAPAAYNGGLIQLQEDIQERIQTLILGDLGNVTDDATPPKYQELVDRYYEVLSRSSAGRSEARKPKSEMKAKQK